MGTFSRSVLFLENQYISVAKKLKSNSNILSGILFQENRVSGISFADQKILWVPLVKSCEQMF